jgi:phosphoribosylanthranilate isomerase
MVKVKICGITDLDDALAAVKYGADALGFVFYRKSPRYIGPDEASAIIRELPPLVTTVGVFVDEDRENVERVMDLAGLDVAQFHGSEPPDACLIRRRAIKAIRVRDVKDLEAMHQYRVSAYLLDTHSPHAPGGTGEVFNWDIALEAKKSGRIILAGGLTPGNIEEAAKRVRPYAVDVASGVEAEPGRKDHGKVRLFIERAKGFEAAGD